MPIFARIDGLPVERDPRDHAARTQPEYAAIERAGVLKKRMARNRFGSSGERENVLQRMKERL